MCERLSRRIASGVPVKITSPPVVAAFGAKVDQPVAGVDHIEIVFNNHNGVPSVEQLVERSEQLGDVVKVQTGGRLVEHEQLAARFGRVFRLDAAGSIAIRRPPSGPALSARCPASLRRCASPPESVGTGCPRRT